MAAFIDFYKIIDELSEKESSSRTEKLKLLQKAWGIWQNRPGSDAVMKANLIKKAIEVFKDEHEYRKYRETLLKERHMPYIHGLLSDGVLTEEEKRGLDAKVQKDGFSQQEIAALLATENIAVSKTEPERKTDSTTSGSSTTKKLSKKDKATHLTVFSTTAVSTICGIYLVYLLNIIVLPTVYIVSVIGAGLICVLSVVAIQRKRSFGFLTFTGGAVFIWVANIQVFFALLPILLTYLMARPLFKLYPKNFLTVVIPSSACAIGWLGFGVASGDLKIVDFITEHLRGNSAISTTGPTGIVIEEIGAKIRSGPSTSYRKITALPKGQSLTILGKAKSANWYKVQFVEKGKMKTGYVHSNLVQVSGSVANLPEQKETKTPKQRSGEVPQEQQVPSPPSDSESETTPKTPENRELQILPPKIAFEIKVNSNPSDARLYLNGGYIGQTPKTIHVAPGKVTLAVKKSPNFPELTKEIVVTDSSVTELNFDLVPVVGNLVGTWEGSFGNNPIQTFIQSQDRGSLIGYSEVRWSSHTSTTNFSGRIDAVTKIIILDEQGDDLAAGKFRGRLSADGRSITGKWEGYKSGQTYDWSIKFSSPTVRK